MRADTAPPDIFQIEHARRLKGLRVYLSDDNPPRYAHVWLPGDHPMSTVLEATFQLGKPPVALYRAVPDLAGRPGFGVSAMCADRWKMTVPNG